LFRDSILDLLSKLENRPKMFSVSGICDNCIMANAAKIGIEISSSDGDRLELFEP
jgi:hypothetical protein